MAALSVTPIATPTLSFYDLSSQTLTACEATRILWALQNEIPASYSVNLRVIAAANQTVPPGTSTSATSSAPLITTINPTTSSAVRAVAQASSSATPRASSSTNRASASTPTSATSGARLNVLAESVPLLEPSGSVALEDSPEKRTLLPINQTLTGSTPQQANIAFQWTTINVPAGRYYLTGQVTDPYRTFSNSSVFTVVEGNDTSCLGFAAALSLQMGLGSSTSTSSTVASQVTGQTQPQAAQRARSGLSGGAIAGVVIGVLAALGLLAPLAFCLFRRRRRQNTRAMSVGPEMSETRRDSQAPYGGIHSYSDSGSYDVGPPAPYVGDSRAPVGTVGITHPGGPYAEATRGEIGEMGLSPNAYSSNPEDAYAPMHANPFATNPSTPMTDPAAPTSPWATSTLVALGGGTAGAAGAVALAGRGDGSGESEGSHGSHGGHSAPKPFRVSSAESSPVSPDLTTSPTDSVPLSAGSTPPSESDHARAPGSGPGPALAQRRGSARRKPVPSLGPALVQAMRADNERRVSGGVGMGIRGLDRKGSGGSDSERQEVLRPHQLEVAPPLPQDD